MPLEALPYVLLLGFLFGSTLVASRFGVAQFAPSTYIGLRLSLASAACGLIYAIHPAYKWPTDARLWRRATLLGVVGTAIPMTAIVTSLRYQSSGVTSILLTANPALTVLFAHYALKDERLTRRKVVGLVLALGGALLLTLRGESGIPGVHEASPMGYGLVLAAMTLASGATIYMRRYLAEYAALDVSTIRFLAAALTVLPLSALLLGLDFSRVDGRGYLVLGYAGLVGTFIGLLLAFYIVKRFGATSAAMTAYVIPLVATVGGALLLGEQITPGMVAGMGIIVGGIALLQMRA
ncbi:MAG: DMT family transporter [Ardenticatenales bacterium]|nr:DMT family transporter [Ardenticatenales bacterium]